MFRLRKLPLLTAVLAGAVVLAATAPQARASNLIVDVYLQEGSTRTLVTGGEFTSTTGTASKTFVSITDGKTTFNNITISATSNQPGGNTGNLAQTSVSATSSSGGGLLVIDVQEASGFTSPGSSGQNLILTSKVSNSTTPGNAPLTFQSWANNTGTAFTGTTPGKQTYDANVGANVSPNLVRTNFTRGNQYYLSNELTVGAGDDNLNVSGTESVATPAPAGCMLALTGLPFFGLGTWLRRRKQTV